MLDLLPLAPSRACIYALLAIAPLLELVGRDRQTRGVSRSLTLRALAPGCIAGLLALLSGRPLLACLGVTALTASYLAAWIGLHAALGRGRVAAAVVALTCWLPVAATFAPNACVESPPGRLVASAAPQVLVHATPIFTMGHQLLEHPLMVEHYFYHQGDAPPPPLGRLIGLYALLACAGLTLGTFTTRARPASPSA